jgi:hypothetical protein
MLTELWTKLKEKDHVCMNLRTEGDGFNWPRARSVNVLMNFGIPK